MLKVSSRKVVRQKRFELSHPCGRYHLKVVRLPISPPPHEIWECKSTQNNYITILCRKKNRTFASIMVIKKRVKVEIPQITVGRTNFILPTQTYAYNGKVRDVYVIRDHYLVMITTDRLSAFDYILPRPIPHKGQVLNQLADYMLDKTADIIPNWKISTPDPNVMIGIKCDTFPIEVVVRGYLAGSAWRAYKSGQTTICGIKLPKGLKENDKLPQPILTPTTKAEEGHDMNISKEEILAQNLVSKKDYEKIEDYAMKLYARGSELAAERGLILVDTKYEFGKDGNKILLIDEVHTPDSSRYFIADEYESKQKKGEKQEQLSKEFVREWLMTHGFHGRDGEIIPAMPDSFIDTISNKYIQLYEALTGMKFEKIADPEIGERIHDNIKKAILKLK